MGLPSDSMDSQTETKRYLKKLDFDEIFRYIDDLEANLESFREKSNSHDVLVKKLSDILFSSGFSPKALATDID
jgi:hypothetical protein